MNRIALLATGDEITCGDIVNTNSQVMAQQLTEAGLEIGFHLSCSDDLQDIYNAIEYLLGQHQVLIITGGLGPTSDDRTRFALAKVINKELQFHQPSWDWIIQRHKDLNIPVPESNRQQALFPEGAQVLNNANGSANACYYRDNDKWIFMLPGPPQECLPIFQNDVLPLLNQSIEKNPLEKLKWQVFGLPEAMLAERMENLIADYACITGYRWHFPYIDFKIYLKDKKQKDKIIAIVDSALAEHIICPADQTAIEVLQHKLLSLSEKLLICDKATGGLLESNIHHPDNHPYLIFSDHSDQNIKNKIIITGLEDYWQNRRDVKETILHLQYFTDSQQSQESFTIPYRHQRVRLYALELIAARITEWLIKK